jgi:hypothetical protein
MGRGSSAWGLGFVLIIGLAAGAARSACATTEQGPGRQAADAAACKPCRTASRELRRNDIGGGGYGLTMERLAYVDGGAVSLYTDRGKGRHVARNQERARFPVKYDAILFGPTARAMRMMRTSSCAVSARGAGLETSLYAVALILLTGFTFCRMAATARCVSEPRRLGPISARRESPAHNGAERFGVRIWEGR